MKPTAESQTVSLETIQTDRHVLAFAFQLKWTCFFFFFFLTFRCNRSYVMKHRESECKAEEPKIVIKILNISTWTIWL